MGDPKVFRIEVDHPQYNAILCASIHEGENIWDDPFFLYICVRVEPPMGKALFLESPELLKYVQSIEGQYKRAALMSLDAISCWTELHLIEHQRCLDETNSIWWYNEGNQTAACCLLLLTCCLVLCCVPPQPIYFTNFKRQVYTQLCAEKGAGLYHTEEEDSMLEFSVLFDEATKTFDLKDERSLLPRNVWTCLPIRLMERVNSVDECDVVIHCWQTFSLLYPNPYGGVGSLINKHTYYFKVDRPELFRAPFARSLSLARWVAKQHPPQVAYHANRFTTYKGTFALVFCPRVWKLLKPDRHVNYKLNHTVVREDIRNVIDSDWLGKHERLLSEYDDYKRHWSYCPRYSFYEDLNSFGSSTLYDEFYDNVDRLILEDGSFSEKMVTATLQ